MNQNEKLVSILYNAKIIKSNGEGKRLIQQGGIQINKEKVDDIHLIINKGEKIVIKIGKRKFLKIL